MNTRLIAFLVAILILTCGNAPAALLEGEMALAPAAAANNAFALDLYARLRAQDGNLFLSPYSVSTAVAMVSAGAAGQTEKEIAATLHLPQLSPADRHLLLGQLIQRYQADRADKGYELHVADALWIKNGLALQADFLRIAQTSYAAQASLVDFLQPTQAAATINDWVSSHTGGKIKNLIAPSSLDQTTRLVLTNAIYFKGAWEMPFETSQTQDGTWHSAGGDKTVPMMHQRDSFGFFEDDSLSALSMPYFGGQLEMLILLPKKPDGISDLEKSIDPARLFDLSKKMEHPRVIVSLPKFRMDSSFDLGSVLKDMGMPTAFSSDADFSGIDGKHDLLITSVVHKAFVDVDEKGTEAAAATGMTLGAAAVVATEPRVFNADHPFMFVIRDARNKTILFMGRVSQP